MKTVVGNWTLSHTKDLAEAAVEKISAHVPGAVQLDYADALGYPPYYYGTNFRQFFWMEDEYFIYETTLFVTCEQGECAKLHLSYIDYRYDILIDGETVYSGEGIFTPVMLDVTRFAGREVPLKIILHPIPKLEELRHLRNRSQAAACCKPASSYGWDWHPRLTPIGIWEEIYWETYAEGAPLSLEASYRLTEDLSQVTVTAEVETAGQGTVRLSLTDLNGCEVAVAEGNGVMTLTLDQPELWYPRGYGEQPLYTLAASGAGQMITRRIGFRRSKLILTEGSKMFERSFPKGPICAPAQIEINGRTVFAKGSNWVNTEIFPNLATKERYDELIALAADANMNIFRMWGGQYINHEYFYEKCDEMGIMIWQEFMLSCNRHPDTDDYLAVLGQEAVSIIKRLRTHPCLTFWCGGNELFNSWSGLTLQSHPLRLLDKLCFEHDRFTPFQMTSPMHGVSHGSYVKVVFPDAERRAGDYSHGEEFICAVKRSKSTGYTEFGCNGASPADYIRQYIMDEKDYQDCNAENGVWMAHHAFKAWNESCWLGIPEIHHFFGGYENVDDLIEKSIYLQDLCYQSMFEEMRRQAPLCAMAINWDFNEPWPCAAGNSLINWPAKPKSCLQNVKAALRPTLLSLNIPRNRWISGEVMEGEIWVLNDSDTPAEPMEAEVTLVCGEARYPVATLTTETVEARKNGRFGTFSLPITAQIPERFSIELTCAAHPEANSRYALVHRLDLSMNEGKTSAAMGGNDDFSDFLK